MGRFLSSERKILKRSFSLPLFLILSTSSSFGWKQNCRLFSFASLHFLFLLTENSHPQIGHFLLLLRLKSQVKRRGLPRKKKSSPFLQLFWRVCTEHSMLASPYCLCLTDWLTVFFYSCGKDVWTWEEKKRWALVLCVCKMLKSGYFPSDLSCACACLSVCFTYSQS